MADDKTRAFGAAGWFAENLYPSVRFAFKAERVLHHEDTGHFELALIENAAFGKVLMLDGITQVTTGDEFIYHEMMSHVPILAHGAARRVLIIGGGDCGMAEEVLKHKSVERLTQVEIDASVVEFSRTHFGDFNAPVFDDNRFDLVIADGADYVATTEDRFDVAIVDSTDPVGPGAVLFTAEFYAGLHRVLTPGGVAVTQNGVPFFQKDELVGSMRDLGRSFALSTAYVAAIPTYVGGHMAMGFATDDAAKADVPLETLAARFAQAGLSTRYYTPAVHRAAFALPRFIEEAVEEGRGQI
ncbi:MULTISPECIES: polyamine aminopropyltransferase [unclassified Roseitalea]|uniref:polyamine aminopropyltransferase n=1 Tax=unclassified Roseitalea TaxID=2639107 RepID=UPI00273F631D|nr:MULTISPECIES: polyamine aminopropyltransferase [unclassified Roseitalea]